VPSGDHELFAHVAALMSGVSPLPSAFITPSWVMYWSTPVVCVIATASFALSGDHDGRT
jgi:hypothetical protein